MHFTSILLLLIPVVLCDNLACWKGEFNPGVTTSQIAIANLCRDCQYCLKIDGTRGGASYQYRDCGCRNNLVECNRDGLTVLSGQVPGVTGNMLCCTGNHCNSAQLYTTVPAIITAVMVALFMA